MRNLGQVVLFVAFRHMFGQGPRYALQSTQAPLCFHQIKRIIILDIDECWRICRWLTSCCLQRALKTDSLTVVTAGELCEQLMGLARVRGAPTELLHITQLLPSPPQPQPVGIGSFQVLWPKSRGSYDLLSHISLCPQQVLPALFEMDPEPFHTPYLHCYYLRLKHGLPSLFLLCLQAYSFFPPAAPRGLWDLSSPTKGWTRPPAVKAQSPHQRRNSLQLWCLGDLAHIFKRSLSSKSILTQDQHDLLNMWARSPQHLQQ